ncbi:hypothetical protein BC941DRAFT_511404 [Chlamydoabsidia padenii]|nr:hypothetical protein BC941DRAFT_511404 [Chlamydoabsidia padenii]
MILKLGFTLCVYIASSAALHSGPVMELTYESFEKQVLDNDKLVAVNFYAPWCGHCQNLAPEWKKVAKSLDGMVMLASLNCHEGINKSLCKQHGVTGFPTIKVFRQSTNKKGTQIKKSTEYQGPRDAKSLKDYLLNQLPSKVRTIKGDASKVKSKKSISLDAFLELGNSTLTKVILFTPKMSTIPLYKALSLDFGDGRLLMGEVKKTEKKVMDALGVEKVPSLIVLTPGKEGQHLVYDGKLKYRPLYDYLSTFASKPATHNTITTLEKEPLEPPIKMQVNSNVIELETKEEFEKQCLTTDNTLCAIAIISPGEEKEKMIELLNEINIHNINIQLHFGWMTKATAASIIHQLDLAQEYPPLLILHAGKQQYYPYTGTWDYRIVTDWVDQVVSGRVLSHLGLRNAPGLAVETTFSPKNIAPVRDEL